MAGWRPNPKHIPGVQRGIYGGALGSLEMWSCFFGKVRHAELTPMLENTTGEDPWLKTSIWVRLYAHFCACFIYAKQEQAHTLNLKP